MSTRSADRVTHRWVWLVPLASSVLTVLVLWMDPLALRILRNATFDQYQRWQPRAYRDAPVRIVDIDDESLRRLGQWPWPRTRIAELVEDLQNARAASISLDIVLAEPDRTSPLALLQGRTVPPATAQYVATLPDHDRVLADVLHRGRVAIGFALTGEPADSTADIGPSSCSLTKAGFQLIGDSPLPQLPLFGSCVPSLMALRQAAAGHGALTFVPDADGVVRRVPLFANLEGSIVPSLSAEALRLAEGASHYSIRTVSGDGGIDAVGIGKLKIPTNAEGALWVHYSRPRPERYLPAWKVLAHAVPASELAGMVIVVGTSAQGLMDLRFSPLGGIVPGVEVHAQAIEQVLTDQLLTRPAWASGAELLAAVAGSVIVGVIAMSCGAALSVAMFAALSLLMFAGAWQAFSGARLLLDPSTTTLAWLVVFLPTTVVRHVMSERRQRWVRQAFARYVSPNLVDYLIAHPGALELGGSRQRCSFVFADLAGFTTLMETMDPAASVTVLNGYLDRMIAIAFEHEGTLDRIVGDSIAIVFSTPVEQSDHAQRALNCALAMHRFARTYVDELAARGIAFCETRIGVHSGDVTVGNFGGSTIFDYRALGDPVNTASRLEGANKYLGTSVCVSEATLAGCAGIPARPIGRLQLAGRLQPVMAYEPLEASSFAGAPDTDYAAAYEHMAAKQPEALQAFELLASHRPGDPLIALQLRRLRAGACGDLIELGGK
ncbi:adenylate/guanylate cyclase domain-containing protein [soil metagenome]